MTAAELIGELTRPWRHGEHFDGRGLVIEEPVVLDGLRLRGFDLSQVHFKAGLSARGATFLGLAWLRGAHIAGACDLSGARFRIDLRAEELQADTLCLDGVEILGVLALARAQARRISLADALIMANLTLEGAAVSEEFDMSRAEVLGGLWADDARLAKIAAAGSEVSGRLRNWRVANSASA